MFVPFLVMSSVFVTLMHGFMFPALCEHKHCAVSLLASLYAVCSSQSSEVSQVRAVGWNQKVPHLKVCL